MITVLLQNLLFRHQLPGPLQPLHSDLLPDPSLHWDQSALLPLPLPPPAHKGSAHRRLLNELCKLLPAGLH